MPARFLVVEDSAPLARALSRFLREFGDPIVVGTALDADRVLAEGRSWAAFVIDVNLPDGSGLDVLARARVAYPTTRALILTASTESDAINRAYDLDADYLVKPFDVRRVKRFVETLSFEARLESVVRRWSGKYRLSSAETDVLMRAARGDPRDEIASARGAAPLTVKKQIANLLKKTAHTSLRVAVEHLLREAGAL